MLESDSDAVVFWFAKLGLFITVPVLGPAIRWVDEARKPVYVGGRL